MFAYRLAWKLGRIDVDEMLNEISPSQFAEWIAAHNLGLNEESWLQAGTIAATIHNEIQSALHSYAGKQMPEKSIQSPADYNPYAGRTKRKKRYNAQSIQTAKRLMLQRYGAK